MDLEKLGKSLVRLGRHVDCLPRNQEELEEMADARVPDEEIFYRDPNMMSYRDSNMNRY